MNSRYFMKPGAIFHKRVAAIGLVLLLAGGIFTASVGNNLKSAHAATENDIMGTSQLTGAQLAQWFKSRKGNAWGASMQANVATVASLYVSEGKLEGVRGDVAFMQGIWETGWFMSNCAGIRNNYSGLRAPSTCTEGWIFESPQMGIRSQIQQLRNYADKTLVQNFANEPRYQGNSFVYKGKVTTWTGLNGKWAVPGTTYGQSILGLYNQALAMFGLHGYCAQAPLPENQITGSGYLTYSSNGSIYAHGSSKVLGTIRDQSKNNIVAMAKTPTNNGYYLAGSDGGVAAFGDAKYRGSLQGRLHGTSIVTITVTPSGKGYWLLAANGGIAAFGDAKGRGDLNGRVKDRVVDMASTSTGRGYWILGSDGGVAVFGDARSYGSLYGRVKSAMVGIAPLSTGRGYLIAGSDGGVAAFGNAKTHGSLAGCGRVVNSISIDSTNNGYYLSAKDGFVASFGDAKHFGYANRSIIGLVLR